MHSMLQSTSPAAVGVAVAAIALLVAHPLTRRLGREEMLRKLDVDIRVGGYTVSCGCGLNR